MVSSTMEPPAQDILHQYRLATQAAALAQSPDEEAAAYMQVVRFCENSPVCQLDDSVKRHSVMFWSYNNIGDALMRKNPHLFHQKRTNADYKQAVDSYSLALLSAKDSAEKISTLNKISRVYKQIGDKSMWLKTREQIINELAERYKYAAYAKLAKNAENPQQAVWLLENALTYVTKADVSVRVKLQNMLETCDKLQYLYHRLKNTEEENRIKALSQRTALLMMTAIERRLMLENEPQQRQKWYNRLLRVGNKYLPNDKLWKIQMLQQLQHELSPHDVWRLSGQEFSLKSIEKMLRQI